MIDPLPLDDLTRLWERSDGPCLSIYLPMETRGKETRQNPIRFKNALKEAEAQLEAQSLRPNERETFIAPLRDLQEDRPFWQHQAHGLAVFRTRDDFRTYRTNLSLPELTVVSDRFHLKPLLGLFAAEARFYVLTLSLGGVTLYEGTVRGLHEIDLPDTPRSMEEALRYDVPEKSLQYHSKTPPPQQQPQQGGQRPAIFHGHGAAADDLERKKDALRFFQEVDRGANRALAGQEAPLLLAGLDHEVSLYREANSYPHLLAEAIPAHVADVSQEELCERAWDHVRPVFERDREERIERLRALEETDQVSTETRTIVQAATVGRIDTLFVPVGVQRWGIFDPNRLEVEEHPDARVPGDVDLLDTAAVWALRNGGTVYVEDPAGTDLKTLPAAIFRY